MTSLFVLMTFAVNDAVDDVGVVVVVDACFDVVANILNIA